MGRGNELSVEPIVVLGMYRSGTSSIAGALSKLGVFFGDPDAFFPVDDFNQTGYWELSELMEVNRKMLAGFGMNSIHARPLPSNWGELPGMEWMVPAIRQALTRQFGGHPVWGWKEPQTCPLMPVYRHALSEAGLRPHYVICVRNPLDTLASQRDLGPLPLIGFRALGLWLHYTLSALRESKGERRSVVLYESFLEAPRDALAPVVERIPELLPTESQWSEAAGSVKPALCHSRSRLEGLEDHLPLLGHVYRVCLACAKDPSGLESDAYDTTIESLWTEWLYLCEMTRTDDLPYGLLTVSWQNGKVLEQVREPFAPKGAWQKLRVLIPAPPGTELRIHLYHLPCQVWVRKARWQSGVRAVPVNLVPGPNGMVEDHEGLRRINIFGPDHLRTTVPQEPGDRELEIEILLQSNAEISARLVTLLRHRVEQLVQGGGRR